MSTLAANDNRVAFRHSRHSLTRRELLRLALAQSQGGQKTVSSRYTLGVAGPKPRKTKKNLGRGPNSFHASPLRIPPARQINTESALAPLPPLGNCGNAAYAARGRSYPGRAARPCPRPAAATRTR
eukprot:9480753-Pyramimonas_sp.AAC.1